MLSRSGGPWQLYGMAGVFRAAGGDNHLGTLADTGIGCLCNERSMARGSGAFSRIHTDTKTFFDGIRDYRKLFRGKMNRFLLFSSFSLT